MSFQEFPKMMVHPAHQPAVLSTIFPLGYKPKPGERENPGQPERFPPITVNDANQQEMYEARGYFVQGSSDAAAFEHAAAGGTPPGYAYNEYPKMVTTERDGERVEVIVHSQKEEHELLGYNPAPDVVAAPKNKGGRPKGSGKKQVSDKMAVSD